MATFVLVHGAWQSAGTWDLLVPLLRQRGHRVIVPLLTGLGTHEAQLSPTVSLSQHIEDVAAVVAESTAPVVLAGHSYAGMIISGVASRAATGQIDSLVYLDAFVPEDGQCVLDLLPATIGEHFRTVAMEQGDGWRLPGGEAQLDLWGLVPGPARDFAKAHLCDFSLRCFEEKLSLPSNRRDLPSRFVSCVSDRYPAKPFFLPFAEKARANGWKVFDIDSGHDCQIERPEAVAAALVAP